MGVLERPGEFGEDILRQIIALGSEKLIYLDGFSELMKEKELPAWSVYLSLMVLGVLSYGGQMLF